MRGWLPSSLSLCHFIAPPVPVHPVSLSYHPTLNLAVALILLMVIQLAWGSWLALGLVPLALRGAAAGDFRRLLRRTRWLLLSLALVFALGTPGSVWWPPLGMWVTREGLVLAVEHGARLLAVLAVVAELLARTPPQALAAGLLTLLAPLRWLGVPVNRAVARLVLVLRTIDQVPTSARAGGAGTWRLSLAALAGPVPAGAALPGDRLEIPLYPMAPQERWLLGLLVLIALGLAILSIGGMV